MAGGLLDAFDYLVLLSAEPPERFERAARKWFVRLLAEVDELSFDDAQLAIACLRSLPRGDVEQLRASGNGSSRSRASRRASPGFFASCRGSVRALWGRPTAPKVRTARRSR